MAQFKVGDIVQLKSGGPQMTVEKTPGQDQFGIDESYHCQWFSGSKLSHGCFPFEALQKTDGENHRILRGGSGSKQSDPAKFRRGENR